MSFKTKQELNIEKFIQGSGSTLNLSGTTIVYGKLRYGNSVAITGSTQVPTKLYVDNRLLTGSTANNGITKNSNNFRLGGTLTGTTSIIGAQILNLGTTGSRLSQFNANASSSVSINSSTSNVNIGATSGFVNITSSNASSNGILIQSQNSLTLEGKTITMKGIPSSLAGITILGNTDTMFLSTGADLFIGGQPGFQGAKYDVDYSADFGPRSLVDKGYVTGLTTTLVTANNGLNKIGGNIRLGGSLTGSTTITTTSSNNLLVAGFPIRYTSDLSANFNTRSLVDKAYVTGITTTLTTTANNGITKTGTNFYLGGSLTGNTSIAGSSSSLSLVPNSLLLQSVGANVTNGINLNSTNGGIIIQKNGGGGGEIRIQSDTGITYQVSNNGRIRVQHSSGLSSSFAGIEYTHNYAANFGPRSLVDKDYVTGLTSGFITAITASNGLTIVGNDIQLGGTLLGSTTIDVNAQQLSFTNLESVSFGSTGNTLLYISNFSGHEIVQVDVPLTLAPYSTSLLLNASGYTRSLIYDTDTNEPKYSDGNQWLSLGSGTPIIVGITANTTLTSSRYKLALVNTSSSGLTVTLPTTPTNGDIVIIKDRVNNALNNNVNINGNGKNIDGSGSATVNTNGGSLKMIYSNEFDEWYVVGFF